MPNIVFKDDTGVAYSATLNGDRLSDIRRVDESGDAESVPGGGSGVAAGYSSVESEPDGSVEDEGGVDGDVRPPNKVFVEQLKAVLVNNRARKQLRHRQKGVLDTRDFVRVQLDSPSVWRQHNRKESQRNYSVLLLVDESGSMRGEKAVLAQDVTQEVIASLGEVGGVETAVIGFSGNRIVERKRFDNSGRISLDSISESSGRTAVTRSGKTIDRVQKSDQENADLMAMDYSLNYLRRNASPNSKLVFVLLSDGLPCESRSEIAVVTADMKLEMYHSPVVNKVREKVGADGTNKIHRMHRLIRKSPDIQSFGLGMLRGGQQVPKHKIVRDLNDTKKELLGFLRSALQ